MNENTERLATVKSFTNTCGVALDQKHVETIHQLFYIATRIGLLKDWTDFGWYNGHWPKSLVLEADLDRIFRILETDSAEANLVRLRKLDNTTVSEIKNKLLSILDAKRQFGTRYKLGGGSFSHYKWIAILAKISHMMERGHTNDEALEVVQDEFPAEFETAIYVANDVLVTHKLLGNGLTKINKPSSWRTE